MDNQSLIASLEVQLEQLQKNPDDDALSLLDSWKQSADSGSENHQLTLGRYYYHLSETTDGEEGHGENAKKAVDWLIKASRQGNEAATELLNECCAKSTGVTDATLPDVRWCLQTPVYEKRARRAAQSLFQTLNPVTQADKMSKDNFKKALDQQTFGKKEKKLIEKAGKLKNKEDLTQEEFVDRLVHNLRGYGGSLTSMLQQDIEWQAFANSTTFQKMTKYPGKTFSWLADNAIEVTGKQGMSWLRSLIPTNQIYMLMIFFLYSLLSAQVIFWFLPLLLFYLSFVTMLVCTLQMFYSRRKTKDVKILADMLNKFNEALSSDSAESAYSWMALTPYVVFFVALISTILSFLMADKTWIPCAEMSFIAAFFTVGCFFALSDKYDHLAILSMVLDNVSTLPAMLEGFPRIPVLYHILSFFFGAGFSIELLPDMYLQIGVPSIAYMLVPVLFLRMARQNSWQGTYRILVPHLVCFFWWRLAMMFFKHSSWLGVFRASIGWVSFILLLPFLVVFVLIWTVMYLSSVLTVGNVLKIVTTIGLLAIPAAFAFWAKTGFKIKGFSPDLKSNKMKSILGIVFILSVLPATFLFSPPERDVKGHYVTWDQYRRLCSKPHWEEANMAASMVVCSQLSGTMVSWTGRVGKIVIKKSENQAEGFINMLPWAVANWLKCTYGEEYPECDTIENAFVRESCQINQMQGRNCHMTNLNRYTFEIWVQMPVDESTVHDVRVEANHWFKDVLMQIKAGDEIQITASLQKELGNKWPELKLYHISCSTCPSKVEFGTRGLTSKLLETYGVLLHVKSAFQGLWNFFLAPVVEFYHVVTD